MRKSKLMKRLTVAVVSVSTALPTVAPAIPAFADELDGITDGDLDGDATPSTPEKDEADIDDVDLVAMTLDQYPEFGSADFVAWVAQATEEELEEWYAAVRAEYEIEDEEDEATDSVPEKEVLSFGTDEFWAWIYEEAAEMSDGEWLYDMDMILEWMANAGLNDSISFMEEFFLQDEEKAPEKTLDDYPKFASKEFWKWYQEGEIEDIELWHSLIAEEDGNKDIYSLNYDEDEFWEWFMEECMVQDASGNVTYNFKKILDWVKHVSFANADALLLDLSNRIDMDILGKVGSLWPDEYIANADLYNDGVGRGTEESPYIIDSVADLRLFAATIAGNESSYNEDTYYLIENGTYDLNGCWIPVGGSKNDGESPVAFLGHIAAEDNVIIENMGIKANATLGVSSDMASKIASQSHYGFFAKLGPGSTVTGLNIRTSNTTIATVSDYTGILAGEAIDSKIKECTTTGFIKASFGFAGGIVGYAHGTNTGNDSRGCVIENCHADEVAVWTTNDAPSGFVDGHSAVGGIVGYAKNTSIIDVTVDTNSGSGNHIYGADAFVGGIAGAIKNSNVINSYMQSGVIGSSESYAVGGLVGGYEGGEVKVGRFSGTITAPTSGYNYSACFLGTATNNTSFTYGENGDVAYLFADTKSKADKGVFGGKPADIGGSYGTDAHIGYWHDGDKGYTLISGSIDKDSENGDYFYEELERGIMACIKSDDPNTDTLDHYTCDNSGNPVRGYLLTIATPTVDSVEAANITAYVLGNNYRKPCTSENQVAFAEGDVVYLSLEALKNGDAFFQLDENVAQNPWYTYNPEDLYHVYDEDTEKAGVNKSGGFHFTMPASDTTVGAEYKAVSDAVAITPARVVFEVTQVRTGTREKPSIEWLVTAYDADPAVSASAKVIKDGKGNAWENKVVATQTSDGTLYVEDTAKFFMSSIVNGEENTTYNLDWQFSNSTTIASGTGNGIISNLVTANGNSTAPSASFMFNVTDETTSAIAKQAAELAEQQKNDGYKNSISTVSPYYYHSIVTATALPEQSFDAVNPPVGYLDATFKFNILDQTQVAVKGVALSQNNITYDVVRTLTGDRKNPTVKYTINGESDSSIGSVNDIYATFNPDYFSKDQVSWYITDTGKDEDFATIKNQAVESDMNVKDNNIINLTVSETNHKNIVLNLEGVTETSAENNGIINGWVKTEDLAYTSKMKQNPGTPQTYKTLVKVTAKDASKNTVTDTCLVTINFKTEDKTEIVPTTVEINDKSHIYGYKINYIFGGNLTSNITDRLINMDGGKNDKVTNGVGQTLSATVKSHGEVYDNTETGFNPYEDTVVWSLANPTSGSAIDVTEILAIDPDTGAITVRGYNDATDKDDLGFSPWIKGLIDNKKLNGTTVPVRIYVTSTKDANVFDYVDINVSFAAKTAALTPSTCTFDIVKTQKVAQTLDGTDIVAAYEWKGYEDQEVVAIFTGTTVAPTLKLYNADGTEVVKNGILSLESEYDADTQTTVAQIKVNRDHKWFKDIEGDRASDNSDTKEFYIVCEGAENTQDRTDITVNFRYDGLDMTAETLTVLPSGYEATPDEYEESTPSETYDVTKANVKDRDITMDVVVTQGSKTANVEATKKWSYGIIDVENTYYSVDGVEKNAGTYTLTGDIAKYAKVDENGYLVPIKGEWEKLIANGETRGEATGILTCFKENASGIKVSDSYKVTINFRYDMAYLDTNEKVYNVVYTDTSFTNDKASAWTGLDAFKLTGHFTNASGILSDPTYKSSDDSILTVDADGNVTLKKEWMEQIIADAKDYGAQVFNGTKNVTITASGNNGTTDTCEVTINFRYDQARLNSNEETYTIIQTQKSRTNNPETTWSELKDGAVAEIAERQLRASIHLEDGMQTTQKWNSENTAAVLVNDEGKIQPAINQEWQNAIIGTGTYSDVRKTWVNVTDENNTVKDSCEVTVNYIYEDVELEKNEATLKINLRATGLREDATYEVTGYELDNPAVIHSYDPNETDIVYSVEGAAASFLEVDDNGKISLILPKDASGNILKGQAFKNGASKFIQDAMTHPYAAGTNEYVSTATAVVKAASADGRMADQCNLNIEFVYEDLELADEEQTLDVVIRAVNREKRIYTISGYGGKVDFALHSKDLNNDTVTFESDSDIIKVGNDGTYSLVIPDYASTNWTGDAFEQALNDFVKEAMKHPYTAANPYVTTKDVVLTATSEYENMQDNVVIHVNVIYEEVALDQNTATMDIKLKAKGNADAPTFEWSGDTSLKLNSVINSSNIDNKNVTFKSSDESILKVTSDGTVYLAAPSEDDNMDEAKFTAAASEFIKGAMARPYKEADPYVQTATVTITATDDDGNTDECAITVNLIYEDLVMHNKNVTIDLILRATDLANDKYVVIGPTKSVAADANSPDYADADIVYTSGNEDILSVDDNGIASIVLPGVTFGEEFSLATANEFIQEAAKHPFINGNYEETRDVVVTAATADGTMYDTCTVTMNIKYEELDIVKETQELNVKIKAANREKRVYDIVGFESFVNYNVNSLIPGDEIVTFESDSDIIKVNNDGTFELVVPDYNSTNWTGDAFEAALNNFVKGAMTHPYKANDPYVTTEDVVLTATATSADGIMKDSITIKVNLTYEEVVLAEHEKTMDITLKATGNADAPVYEWVTETSFDLGNEMHTSNVDNKKVTYYSSDESILKVTDDGKVYLATPSDDDKANKDKFMSTASGFILDAMARPYKEADPFVNTATVIITATDEDGNSDECAVTVNLHYEDLVMKNKAVTLDLILRATDLANDKYVVVGQAVSAAADTNSVDNADADTTYASGNTDILSVDAEGNVNIVLPGVTYGEEFSLKDANEFIQEAAKHPYINGNYEETRDVVVTATSKDGTMSDTCTVTMNIKYEELDIVKETQELNVKIKAANREKRVYDIVGFESFVNYNVNSLIPGDEIVTFKSDSDIIKVNNDGTFELVVPDYNSTNWTGDAFEAALNNFVKGAMTHPYTAANPYVTTKDVVLTATATSADGVMKDSITIKVNLTYEEVVLDQHEKTMDITLKATGNADAPVYEWVTETSFDLGNEMHTSTDGNDTVRYESSDPNVLKVDQNGKVYLNVPRLNDAEFFNANASQFIKDAMKNPYKDDDKRDIETRTVIITAYDEDGNSDECAVTVNLIYENLVMQKKDVELNVVLRAKDLANKEYEIVNKASLSTAVLADANSKVYAEKDLVYTSSNAQILTVSEDGVASLVLPDTMNGDEFLNGISAFIKDAMKHPYTKEDPHVNTITVPVKASTADGTMYDTCNVKINLIYEELDITEQEKTLTVKIKAANRNQRVYNIEGQTGKADFNVNCQDYKNEIISFSSDSDILRVAADGTYTLVLPDYETTKWTGDKFYAAANDFVKEAMNHPYTAEDKYVTTKDVVLTATSKDGIMKDSIVIHVNVIYEEVKLDKNVMTMDATLKATGDSDEPVYQFTGHTANVKAVLNTSDIDNKKVTYKSSDESILKVDANGNITLNVPHYKEHDEFIKLASDYIKEALKRPYMEKDPAVHQRTVMITAHDEKGEMLDECLVNVNLIFENVQAKKENVTLDLVLRAKNLAKKEFEMIGSPVDVSAYVNSMSYDNVVYTSSDNKLLTVDGNGKAYITLPDSMTGDAFVNNLNDFLKDALLHPYKKESPYTCTTTATVKAATEDGTMYDECTVTINLIYENTDITDSTKTMDVTITATGTKTNPTYTVTGNTATLKTLLHNTCEDEHGPVYTSNNTGILTVGKDGKLSMVLPATMTGTAFTEKANDFVKEVLAKPYTTTTPYVATREVLITAVEGDKALADECLVKINLKYIDKTTAYTGGGSSSGGGGGSSSGGGGGSSSKGVSPSGTATKTHSKLPSYVISGGTWVKNTEDKWLYTNVRTYTDEWAAVANPYADASKGQAEFDWFHFGKDSFMTVGWYEENGHKYFLHDISDNTLGHMYTGWHWIDDDKDGNYEYYYFEEQSNGYRGSLYRNTTVAGYIVNEKGQWVDQDGKPITRTADQLKTPTQPQNKVPEYVLPSGTWDKNADGKWTFRTDRQYKDEWAAVYNPYADTSKGQDSFDWFHFGKDGFMTVGWYEENGNTFFLHNISDNTLGRMYTGWNWIDDNGDGIFECYYFEEQSNGSRGRLYKNTTVAGYKLNAKGQWVNSAGIVVTRTAADF